jgi:hypothetical protein
MKRRSFLQLALAAGLSGRLRAAQRRPCILLRSSWQVVNIGDIAHTPGVLALIEQHIPEADVILWASGSLSDEVAAMLTARFPQLQIVKGSIGEEGRASSAELQAALDRCDFLLHGSGPSLVGARDVAAFDKHVGKPFGVYGITYGGAAESQRDLMSRAQFVYFRDSVSLAKAVDDGITCPIMEFSPDGAFAVDLRNDDAAERFLAEHQLEEGRFLCCIPRLRYTPYWKIHNREMTDQDRDKHARSEEMQEHDHAPLLEAITALTRDKGYKVLVCPEDMSQMEVGKRLLVDPLPEDVREQVVWRESFWLTDEALSTYVRSAGLFGLEMHSPIMCIGNGVPAVVCRFAEQTSKGFMWRDIGLGDWLFNMDEPADVERIVPTVQTLVADRDDVMSQVTTVRELVQRRFAETMAVVRDALL